MNTTDTRKHIALGGILLAIWAITAWFFYAPTQPLSEQEIDACMGKVQTLLANNSHTAYLASAEPNALNYGTAAGGDADGWGEIGIFRYNSRRDFFNMVTSDDYLNALYLKMVSMGAIAIAPTQPHGLLFNPMPNIPVLVFLFLAIVYLSYLVVALHREAPFSVGLKVYPVKGA